MLYSLPSRDLIADSVEYMVNAHCADAPGLHLQLRQDHPGHAERRHAPEHPRGVRLRRPDGSRQGAVDRRGEEEKARPRRRDGRKPPIPNVSDENVDRIERSACPTCGSCSGMFTANSMNCLTEALGLSLPGNGSLLATHADREAAVQTRRAHHRRPVQTLLRGRRRIRLAAQHRQLRGVRKRDEPRHRHGRFDQHHPAPAGRRRGRRGRLSP